MFGSCASNNQIAAIRTSDLSASKENTAACFIKLKDGSMKNYQTLKLVTGVFVTPHLVGDGKDNIYAKDILAYQNDKHYAISQTLFVNGQKSYVATETLPGFAVRIAKGKLNIYAKKFYNGRAGVDAYFVQSGENGEIYSFTPDLMKSMIKDNQEALTFFNENKKGKIDLSQKLQSTVEMYNNSMIVSVD